MSELKLNPLSLGIWEKYKDDLIALYQEAFSGPPYYESFTEQEAQTIWEELILNPGSNVLAAFIGDRLVGFCGGFRADQDEKITEILENDLSVLPAKAFYLAELGVKQEYRRQGYGTELVREIVSREARKGSHATIVTRTQAQGSNSIKIFNRTDFVPIPELTQKVKTWVDHNGERELQVQERIFLERKL